MYLFFCLYEAIKVFAAKIAFALPPLLLPLHGFRWFVFFKRAFWAAGEDNRNCKNAHRDFAGKYYFGKWINWLTESIWLSNWIYCNIRLRIIEFVSVKQSFRYGKTGRLSLGELSWVILKEGYHLGLAFSYYGTAASIDCCPNYCCTSLFAASFIQSVTD